MRMLRKVSTLAGAGCMALALASCSLAQKIAPASAAAAAAAPEASVVPVPKDARTRAKLHTDLASLYFQDGNLIVALEELSLAAAIDPGFAPAFSTRGVVLYHVKEFASADKDFRTALGLDEKDPEINNNYGWFLCRTGREREALGYFQKALGNPLYRTPGLAYLNEGECYIRLGDLDRAEDSIRMGLRLMPGNPQASFYLADINYRRGNFDAARKYLMDVVRAENAPAEVLWLSLRTERRLGNRIAEESLAARLRRKYPESQEYQQMLKGNFE